MSHVSHQDSAADKALWKSYAADRENPRLRDALCRRYLPWVSSIAAQVAQRLRGHVDAEDLGAEGSVALLDQLRRFDPDRGFHFTSFALQRVRGAMFDAARSASWAPRAAVADAATLERAERSFYTRHGRAPAHAELAEWLEIDGDTLLQIQSAASLPTIGSLEAPASVRRGSAFQARDFDRPRPLRDVLEGDSEDGAQRAARLDFLREQLRGLSKTERLLMIGYYFCGETMRQIGDALGVSESRVSQMHSAILGRLRARHQAAEPACGRDAQREKGAVDRSRAGTMRRAFDQIERAVERRPTILDVPARRIAARPATERPGTERPATERSGNPAPPCKGTAPSPAAIAVATGTGAPVQTTNLKPRTASEEPMERLAFLLEFLEGTELSEIDVELAKARRRVQMLEVLRASVGARYPPAAEAHVTASETQVALPRIEVQPSGSKIGRQIEAIADAVRSGPKSPSELGRLLDCDQFEAAGAARTAVLRGRIVRVSRGVYGPLPGEEA